MNQTIETVDNLPRTTVDNKVQKVDRSKEGKDQKEFDKELKKKGDLSGLDLIQTAYSQFSNVNPIHAASVLIAVIDGLLLHWVFNPESFKLEEIGKDIVELVLKGLER